MASNYPSNLTNRKYFDAAVPFTSNQARKALSESPLKHLQLYTVDRIYYCLSDDLCNELLQEIGTNHIKYVNERFDCDDFASYFRSLASVKFGTNSVGLILDISGEHSYNTVLTCNNSVLEVKIVEPQTDKIITKYPDAEHHYVGSSGFILL